MTASAPHPESGPDTPTEQIDSVPNVFFIPHQHSVFQSQEDSERNTLHSYKRDE